MAGPQSSDDLIRQHLLTSATITGQAATECSAAIEAAARLGAVSLRAGGKLLFCGNGGSAADCQHLAAEFVNVLDRTRKRPALAALALTTDTSLLTAVANDVGFERVFERQLEALGRRGDVLIGITTSGGSPSVLRALARARALGLSTIVLTGASGGDAVQLCDVAVRVPSDDPQHIQEAHIAIGHALCAAIERKVSG